MPLPSGKSGMVSEEGPGLEPTALQVRGGCQGGNEEPHKVKAVGVGHKRVHSVAVESWTPPLPIPLL